MAIYDCFKFYNELELPELRLSLLSDVVNRFVIVEASKMQTGYDKPYYFENNIITHEKITQIDISSFDDKIKKFTGVHPGWIHE